MQEEFIISKAIKLGKPSFGERPKGFYLIHMVLTSGKFIVAMENPIVIITI